MKNLLLILFSLSSILLLGQENMLLGQKNHYFDKLDSLKQNKISINSNEKLFENCYYQELKFGTNNPVISENLNLLKINNTIAYCSYVNYKIKVKSADLLIFIKSIPDSLSLDKANAFCEQFQMLKNEVKILCNDKSCVDYDDWRPNLELLNLLSKSKAKSLCKEISKP